MGKHCSKLRRATTLGFHNSRRIGLAQRAGSLFLVVSTTLLCHQFIIIRTRTRTHKRRHVHNFSTLSMGEKDLEVARQLVARNDDLDKCLYIISAAKQERAGKLEHMLGSDPSEAHVAPTSTVIHRSVGRRSPFYPCHLHWGCEPSALEATHWHLVHADVFMKTHHSMLLAVCIGSCVQTLGMAIVTLFFALLGFLSPAHYGGLLQSIMFIFTFMGVVAGYVAAKVIRARNNSSGN